jgi:hypothetical protein
MVDYFYHSDKDYRYSDGATCMIILYLVFTYSFRSVVVMSETRKKSRRRRSSDDISELTSIEKSIAKYLRFQCPTKNGILMGEQVVYFNGSKAIECLIESKWSSSSNNGKNPICFSSKHDAVQVDKIFFGK